MKFQIQIEETKVPEWHPEHSEDAVDGVHHQGFLIHSDVGIVHVSDKFPDREAAVEDCIDWVRRSR